MPIFTQRVIYKAKTFIAPRKYIEDETPPEKKKARSPSNICTKLEEEKGNSNLKVNILLLPLTDFHKNDSVYYSNNTFHFKLKTDEPQNSEVKTICSKLNDDPYQIYDPLKTRIEKIGKNSLTVFALDKEANISPEFKFSIYIDKGTPEIEILVDGKPVENKQNIDCRIDSKVELNSSDKEFHLTHIFYRTNNDTNWKYYHKPLVVEQNKGFFLEAKSNDLVGNQSRLISFSCKEEVGR